MSMSDGSEFIKFDIATDLDSLHESHSYHSTQEESSTIGVYSSYGPLDYWFGQRYFKCVLAQLLLPQVGNLQSFSAIDVSPHIYA